MRVVVDADQGVVVEVSAVELVEVGDGNGITTLSETC